MVNFKHEEKSRDKKERLKFRIRQLIINRNETGLVLEKIKSELENCREELNNLGDFP